MCPINSNEPVEGVGGGSVDSGAMDVEAGTADKVAPCVGMGLLIDGWNGVGVANLSAIAIHESMKIMLAELISQRLFMFR